MCSCFACVVYLMCVCLDVARVVYFTSVSVFGFCVCCVFHECVCACSLRVLCII